MRVALAELAADWEDHGEVCIIGSGPAGTTIAAELARAGRRVILLEAGGDLVSDRSQAVYRGEVVGGPYFPLESVRLRCLGGTSNHWGGWCRPLDADDFVAKPSHPLARWPIARSDLDPFLPRTAAILGLPPLPPDTVLDGEAGIERIHFNIVPAVRFWEAFGPELEAAGNVTVVDDANVTLIGTDGDKVTGVEAQDWAGNRRVIRAGRFVLATGGIENSRLLLWSDAAQNGALVARGAPLGRYWMEHPHQTLGSGLIPSWPRFAGAFDGRHYLALTPAARRRRGILACGLRLEPLDEERTKALAEGLVSVAPRLSAWADEALARNPRCGARLRAAWEQAPVAENRVALSDEETDRFGVPRTVLHWRRSAEDMRTARDSALAFAEFLALHELGRLRLEPWLLALDAPDHGEIGGRHHMGGTRMADSPAEGVVDRNCKLFGQSNLYVAGSSVFPSGGHANPTQTVVQLALRLSDHLAALR